MSRRSTAEESEARTALLDAAEAIMLEDGYAAVTTRRIAKKAGLNSALVFYYFDTMDGLFIALFRRGAQQTQERWARVQPGYVCCPRPDGDQDTHHHCPHGHRIHMASSVVDLGRMERTGFEPATHWLQRSTNVAAPGSKRSDRSPTAPAQDG